MRRLHLLVAILVGTGLLIGNYPATAHAQAQPRNRYFASTGHNLSGRFLEYWEGNGGLTQQGYPISEPLSERSDIDGKTYTVQYFERAVFELHPENRAPYDVLLTPLGKLRLAQTYPTSNPTAPARPAESGYFAETGYAIDGRFLVYWQANGGLAQQGYPVSGAFVETSELDGNPYVVQYFERAVFEYHPDGASEVLLAQLGRFRYQQRYGALTRVAPLPGSNQPAPPAPAALATGNSLGVDLLQYDSYVTGLGLRRFVGVVKNNGGVAVDDVSVVVTLFDNAGRVTGTGDDYILIGVVLASGQSVGFFVDVAQPPSSWARLDWRVTARRYDPEPLWVKPTVNLAVADTTIAPGGISGYLVRGRVRNDEAVTSKYTAVIATGFDAAGKIVDADFAFVSPGDIQPGQWSSFTVTLWRKDKRVVRYETLAHGYK